MDIAQFFQKIKSDKVKIAVVGDIVIDQYFVGTVTRFSPEFTVPIVKTPILTPPKYCIGGAGNVCSQLEHFNADVSLFGFVDETVNEDLPNLKFNSDGCVDIQHGRIPRKIRFYDQDFPLLRWDVESPNYGLPEETLDNYRKEVMENFIAQLDTFDVVIISSYDKGLLNHELASTTITECNKRNIPTIVDPKNSPSKWQHCTIFKPNAKEARDMSGSDDWRQQIDYCMQIVHSDSIIITNSGSGIYGKTGANHFEYRSHNMPDDVCSVIGAGDCFISILSLAIAHKLDVEQAAQIAFEAGSQYVQSKHNQPITPYALYRRFEPLKAKIISIDELNYLKNNIYKDHKFGFVNGVFDILHAAHLELLQFSKQHCNKLIVAINDDESVKRLKGPDRPIMTVQDRMFTLANLETVDFVVNFREDTPLETIKSIMPNMICKGGDYERENIVGADVVGTDNVLIFPYKEGKSTSKIIDTIKGKI